MPLYSYSAFVIAPRQKLNLEGLPLSRSPAMTVINRRLYVPTVKLRIPRYGGEIQRVSRYVSADLQPLDDACSDFNFLQVMHVDCSMYVVIV